MNDYIHWKTLQKYIKAKYNIGITIKEFKNELKEMYFICKEDCDLSVVTINDNGITTYFNSNRKHIPAESIFAKLFNCDLAYDEKGIMICWKPLHIEFAERNISLNEVQELETKMFYNKTKNSNQNQEIEYELEQHEGMQMT